MLLSVIFSFRMRKLHLVLVIDVNLLSEKKNAISGDGFNRFLLGKGQGGVVSFTFPQVF